MKKEKSKFSTRLTTNSTDKYLNATIDHVLNISNININKIKE